MRFHPHQTRLHNIIQWIIIIIFGFELCAQRCVGRVRSTPWGRTVGRTLIVVIDEPCFQMHVSDPKRFRENRIGEKK